MLRSLMTAVTGVKAHQVMLDVTGNNIANVNTTGYKRDVTIFQDILYQTTQGAMGPGEALGGINPAQVGLGVRVGAIETIHTQGNYQFTGNKDDVMIQGEGYFVLRNGSSRVYSRAGNFMKDANSDLVHSGTGYKVQGYAMEKDPLDPTTYVKSGDISDINIPIGAKIDANATNNVAFRCNLSSETKPYLPIGVAEIAYRSTQDATAARVTIDDRQYGISFASNKTDASAYLTITFSMGNTSTTLQFDMLGIRPDGYPTLGVMSGTNLVTTFDDELPNGGPAFRATYDNETGSLTLRALNTSTTPPTVGELLWKTNLHESMSYTSFSFVQPTILTTGDVTHSFLVEFEEKPDAAGGSPINMTVWHVEANGAVDALQYKAYINPDGTFDSVLPVLTGTATGHLPNLSFNVRPNAGVNGQPGGSGLEFTAIRSTGGNAETVGQVIQGAMHPAKFTVYDCQGVPYTMEVQFKKLTENRWRWEASFVTEDGTMERLTPNPAAGYLEFDDSCHIIWPNSLVQIEVPYTLLGRENEVINLDFIGQTIGGGDPMEGVTQFAAATTSTTKMAYQDGYQYGVMKDYTISPDGTVTGVYSNSQNIPIARIALAQFANPAGLDNMGNTMFRETANSGIPRIDAAAEDGAGNISSSYLEMSNVDLTEEFTKLIISQRGFQANTRVVTTSDQILEEVVNLKR